MRRRVVPLSNTYTAAQSTATPRARHGPDTHKHVSCGAAAEEVVEGTDFNFFDERRVQGERHFIAFAHHSVANGERSVESVFAVTCNHHTLHHTIGENWRKWE